MGIFQGTLDVAAFGGPLGIRWDEDAKVTRWGGLSYFATFLKASRMFDRLVEDAPFVYTSPNAPKVRDVVGTMVLAILAGYSRYCHIERIRNDAACAELLGIGNVGIGNTSTFSQYPNLPHCKHNTNMIHYHPNTRKANA